MIGAAVDSQGAVGMIRGLKSNPATINITNQKVIPEKPAQTPEVNSSPSRTGMRSKKTLSLASKSSSSSPKNLSIKPIKRKTKRITPTISSTWETRETLMATLRIIQL